VTNNEEELEPKENEFIERGFLGCDALWASMAIKASEESVAFIFKVKFDSTALRPRRK
jgi:hypothetical protein